MAKDHLFRQLCTPKILNLGWQLARLDSRDDFVIDPIENADFAAGLHERLEHLCEEVRSYRYRPRHLLDIDVPKSGLSVRPGNVMPVEECVLLHAVVYLLAPKLDGSIHENVYSYRLHKDWRKRIRRGHSIFREGAEEIPFLKHKTIRKLDPIESWYTAWPEFDEESRRACDELGCTHLTKTDITAYFENIDLKILETQIRSMLRTGGDALIQVLFRVLEGWTRVTSTGTPVGRGIPQGNDVSSFFGNLYLTPLDRALDAFCRKHDGHWCRYVDDVKVFTKSDKTARDAVFLINNELRRLHLNLQGSKTKILTGDALEQEIVDPELDRVNAVIQKVEGLKKVGAKARLITVQLRTLKPIVSRYRTKLPESVRDLSGDESRLLRRVMTLYGTCSRPQLVKTAIAALQELPELRVLKKVLRYLTQQPYKLQDGIVQQLLTIMEEDRLPFPYQVGTVIEAFRFFHPTNPKSIAAKLREIGFSTRIHWYVKQKMAEAIATFPYREDSAWSVSQDLLAHSHPWVRRAGCVLLTRGPVKLVRSETKRLSYHADLGVSRLCLYLCRHIEDPGFAKSEIVQMRKGKHTDTGFIYNLPRLYVLRCSPDKDVVRELMLLVDKFSHTKSQKIGWHLEKLRRLGAWALPK